MAGDGGPARCAHLPRAAQAGVAAAVVTVLLAATACTAPALNTRDYQLKAAESAENLQSAAETARLAVRSAMNDRALNPYLQVLVDRAEEVISAVDSAFMSLQPPSSESDSLRGEVGTLLGDVDDAVAAVRIALEREDRGAMAKQRKKLATLSRKLEALDGRLR